MWRRNCYTRKTERPTAMVDTTNTGCRRRDDRGICKVDGMPCDPANCTMMDDYSADLADQSGGVE
jgi:hypothetical protein